MTHVLTDFQVGDTVVLSRIRYEPWKGRTGTVKRVNKSKRMIRVDLGHEVYDAHPESLDKTD